MILSSAMIKGMRRVAETIRSTAQLRHITPAYRTGVPTIPPFTAPMTVVTKSRAVSARA